MKKRLASMLLLLVLPSMAWAIVDMKSANYTESWTDMNVPGVGYDLRVTRTYNSRSLFNGLFGYGWCSDYETKIDITAEGNLRLTECGGGMEIIYTPKNFKNSQVDQTIEQILTELKKRRPDLDSAYVASLKKELKTNDFMREEFGRRMNIKGQVKDGVVYAANGREAEHILLKNGSYKRVLTDGTFQLFEVKSGQMTHMYDRNQNYLKLSWDKEFLKTVVDNMGRKLTFKYDPSTKKISEILGPGKLLARYLVKDENLVRAQDAEQAVYVYKYDDVHNLVRIDLPDKTFKALTYNKDKDWVLTFNNPKGCEETYQYEVSKDDPKNHFWSNVVKKCGTKVTNRSKYEFFHRQRPDGLGIYLYRVRTENNGDLTDIVYHALFGKPLSIVQEGQRTDYSYFSNGMVRTKKEKDRSLAFEYKNKCAKVSQVIVQYYSDESPLEVASNSKRKPSQAKPSKPKVARVVKTQFAYDVGKCNLVKASTSEGQVIKLQYDTKGRIALMEDQSKKSVKIQYEAKFGKPEVVTRPGLGAIQVKYTDSGEIDKVESAEGPQVAIQVASIFNNLLEIIAPATGETPL